MDFPKPPAWYHRTTRLTPAPPIPENPNIRSFGFPDYDEHFWTFLNENRSIAHISADLKKQNRQLIHKFAHVIRDVANEEGSSEPPEKLFADLATATIPIRQTIDKLRIYEAHRDFKSGLKQQISDRTQLTIRLRQRMASVLHAFESMLLDTDHTDTEETQFNQYEQQQHQQNMFFQHLNDLNYESPSVSNILDIAKSHCDEELQTSSSPVKQVLTPLAAPMDTSS